MGRKKATPAPEPVAAPQATPEVVATPAEEQMEVYGAGVVAGMAAMHEKAVVWLVENGHIVAATGLWQVEYPDTDIPAELLARAPASAPAVGTGHIGFQ